MGAVSTPSLAASGYSDKLDTNNMATFVQQSSSQEGSGPIAYEDGLRNNNMGTWAIQVAEKQRMANESGTKIGYNMLVSTNDMGKFVKTINQRHSSMSQQVDIVDTAIAAGGFNTLVAAVKEANLVETLKGDGPFTVFAPTDPAFAKIPEEKLNALLADKKALSQVLTYHVVPGKVMAKDVVSLSSAQTVQGQAIRIDNMGGVKVDNANVIQTDIETSNGVIHVIDSVILPNL